MNSHLDIGAEVLVGLLTQGAHHNFSVDPGLPAVAQIDDVTYNPLTRTVRLHFDRPVPEPVLHAHSELVDANDPERGILAVLKSREPKNVAREIAHEIRKARR